jgi:tetratricopeptide (TPR) repeat protein
LALYPEYAEAHKNRGIALGELKRLDEALASYDRALSIDPEYADAHWNKSLLLLLMGQYSQGWELYEWRLRRDGAKDDYPAFPKPAWRGQQDIRGKRLLIQAEQGFGDIIQFCRYVHQVKLLDAEIILEAPEPLVSLVSTLACSMTVVTKGTPLPEFDAYCPIMSLPHVFRTLWKPSLQKPLTCPATRERCSSGKRPFRTNTS